MKLNKKRIGKIKISKECWENFWSFEFTIIPYRIEYLAIEEVYEITCEHPCFDEIHETEEIPNYKPEYKTVPCNPLKNKGKCFKVVLEDIGRIK